MFLCISTFVSVLLIFRKKECLLIDLKETSPMLLVVDFAYVYLVSINKYIHICIHNLQKNTRNKICLSYFWLTPIKTKK